MKRLFVCGVTLLTAVGILPTTAFGTELNGTLVLPSTLLSRSWNPSCKNRACYWTEHNHVLDIAPEQLTLSDYIVIALIGPGTPQSAVAAGVVELRGGDLAQHTIVIRQGVTTRWVNKDEFPHAPYAHPPSTFSTERIAPNQSRALTLNQAGHWTVRDTLLPNVQGTLHVVPNLVALGTLKDDGSFGISDIAPGAYRLVVFQAEREVYATRITVPEKGELHIEPISLSHLPKL